eukprot:586953-Pelagomonas_calceolata.AAC.4
MQACNGKYAGPGYRQGPIDCGCNSQPKHWVVKNCLQDVQRVLSIVCSMRFVPQATYLSKYNKKLEYDIQVMTSASALCTFGFMFVALRTLCYCTHAVAWGA